MGWLTGNGYDLILDLGSWECKALRVGSAEGLRQPSFLAYDLRSGSVLSSGKAALAMYGRVGPEVEIRRPFRFGSLQDPNSGEIFLRSWLETFEGLTRPRVLLTLPQACTEVERRALTEVLGAAGARSVDCLPQPLCAAVAEGLPLDGASALAVVDVGAEKTELTLLSMGTVISHRTLRHGGANLERQLASWLRRSHNLVVGPHSLERLKCRLLSAEVEETPAEVTVAGRDLQSGLPRRMSLSSDEPEYLVERWLAELSSAVQETLELAPPELVERALEKGLRLTGGGALLRGLPAGLSRRTSMTCRLVKQPLGSNLQGAAQLIQGSSVERHLLSAEPTVG